MMQEDKIFSELCEVIVALRAPDGCPWDREQTFQSMKPCVINEMTEALAAIDILEETGQAENLCEELGDVLLQVMLLSQIAQEKGLFSIGDVVRGIVRKMVRRHPHVFGEEAAAAALRETVNLREKASALTGTVNLGERVSVLTETVNLEERVSVLTGTVNLGERVSVLTETVNFKEKNVPAGIRKAGEEIAEAEKKVDSVPAAGTVRSGKTAAIQSSEVPGQWESIKRAEKAGRTEEMEQREKEAFKKSAREIIVHLNRKL